MASDPKPPRAWRLAGIPIHVDPSWYFTAVFVAWSLSTGYFPQTYAGLTPLLYGAMGVAAAVLLFGCVLLHELGHALVAKAHGLGVWRVTLFVFGGVAQIAGDPARPSVELWVALAGPAVSVALAAGCALASQALAQPLWPLAAVLRYLAVINLGIILFNLLPGFPLDGGRVLRAVVWALTRNRIRATRVASLLGSALGIGLLVLGVWHVVRGHVAGGLWYVLLGLFLRDAALASLRSAHDDVATPPVAIGPKTPENTSS